MTPNSISVIELFNMESAIATEFRRLLNMLQNPSDHRELKSILVTSAMLSEGKTTVSGFLSLTASRKGLKTLLVDCDLRRPSVHKLFGLPREGGLVEAISEGVAAKNVLKKTAIDKLDIITAGKVVSHPSEVFDAAAIGRVLGEMKFYYDLIICDTAPIIPVSDPMLLAPEVDGVLIVVKAGATQRQIILRAKEIMAGTANKILGVVLNNADNSLPYYYDHGYYGYEYGQTPTGARRSKKGDKGPADSSDGKNNRKADRKAEPKSGNTVS